MSQPPEGLATRAFQYYAVGIVDGPDRTRMIAVEVIFKSSGDHHAWAMTVPEAEDLATSLEIMEEVDARKLGQEIAYAAKQATAMMGGVMVIKPEAAKMMH